MDIKVTEDALHDYEEYKRYGKGMCKMHNITCMDLYNVWNLENLGYIIWATGI